MSEIEIFYNTTLPVGDDIKSGRPCSIIHFNPKTYEVTGEEHYNLENVKFPVHAIESLARAFLPAIQDFYEQLKYYREQPPRFMINQAQSEFGISSPQEAISKIPTDRFYSLVLNEVLEYWGQDGSSFARKHIPFQLIESGYFEPEEQTFGEIKMT